MSKIIKLMIGITMVFTSSCSKSPTLKTTKELKININGEPQTLDPRKGGDVISSSLHFMLFEGLTYLNPDCTTRPAQAESIEISDDRLTYTFHLRDLCWSDGSPVTSQDFEIAWKKILSPSFPAVNAHLFYPIKNAEAAKRGLVPPEQIGIKTPNEKTLVVELENPTPYFLQLTSFCVFFPVNHKIDANQPNWAYSQNSSFVTNGPYMLKTWKHDHEIVLEKNEKYWNRDLVHLDSIHISMVSDEMTALQMYENGDIDMLGAPLSPIPVDALSEFAQKGLLQVFPVAGTTICAFNNQKVPFTNQNIRKAFSLAINRRALVDHITQMQEPVATGPIPPVLKANLNKEFFKDNDSSRAKELFQLGLNELNMESSALDGIIFFYSSSEVNRKIAQAIQQQWFETLGVRVKIESLEHKVLMDKLTKRDYPMALTYWLAQYSDQMNILERYKFRDNPKNYAAWENDEFIALLNQSAVCANENERKQILEKAETLFVEQMPVAPIFHSNSASLLKPYVKDFSLTPIGNIYYTNIHLDLENENAYKKKI